MKGRKVLKAIIIIVIIAAAAAAVWFFFFRNKDTSSENSVFVQKVSSVLSSSGASSRFTGMVEPQQSEKVELDTTRLLKETLVKEGDRVKEGDPLFSYDTESVSLEIEQLNLDLERLNTNLESTTNELAELNEAYGKAKTDADRLEISARIQQAEADIAQTEYDIKSKQLTIESKQASIEDSYVYATLTGTVQKIADAESIIKGTNFGDDGSFSSVYITILADGDMRIKGKVSEQHIFELYDGMPVIIRSRVNDDVWRGMISTIDTQASNDNNNMYYMSSGEMASKYDFYIELVSSEGLMLGQHVIITPDTGLEERADGIWLSSGWLLNEGDKTYVWAAASDSARLEKREVTTGDYDEFTDEYLISSGISKTEYIAWPDSDCAAGAPVTTESVVEEGEIYSVDMEDTFVFDETITGG